jgi:hypothetical protein
MRRVVPNYTTLGDWAKFHLYVEKIRLKRDFGELPTLR